MAFKVRINDEDEDLDYDIDFVPNDHLKKKINFGHGPEVKFNKGVVLNRNLPISKID